jgi:hypothetical protein
MLENDLILTRFLDAGATQWMTMKWQRSTGCSITPTTICGAYQVVEPDDATLRPMLAQLRAA